MSRTITRRASWGAALAVLAALVALDVATTVRGRGDPHVGFLHPVVRPVAAQTVAPSVVAVASSEDAELPDPAPINTSTLTYEQVDAVVRRALDLDASGRSIRAAIRRGDWVAVKVNIVTAPIVDKKGTRHSGFWAGGREHWGDVTDLRVVKSVVNYLIENIQPRRISIVEGSGEWSRKGMGYSNSYDTDGWEVQWREFGDLSYTGMIAEFRARGTATEVDTVDLNDAPYRFEPVPGGPFQRVKPLFRDQDRFGYMVPVPGTGTPRSGYYMPEVILDADKLISIAVMKTNIGGATMAFKNYVGTLSSRPYGDGTSKNQMDANSYERGFVDLFSYNPAAYAIMEGFWAEEGSWPGDRSNLNHNVIVAGGDPLATECVALEIMGFHPLDLEHVYLAAEKGFGTLDPKGVQVVGRPIREIRRVFKKHTGFIGLGFQRWLVSGPHPGGDLTADLLNGEAALVPSPSEVSNGLPWRVWEHPPTYPEAYVDLTQGVTDDLANTVTYAFTLLEAEAPQDGLLWFGADDGARVYLNGALVLDEPGPFPMRLGQFRLPVSLRSGENTLMVKVRNRVGETGFAASIIDASGSMLLGLTPILPGERPTAVEEQGRVERPTQFRLIGNYPNPFNASTQIRFSLPEASEITLILYDALGRRVKTLAEGTFSGGLHTVAWDGKDDQGRPAASGVYLYTLKAGALSETKRMALVR